MIPILLVLLVLSAAALFAADDPPTYPAARKSDQIDDYHGTRVADPYRWLEDTNSAETRAWVEAENQVTSGYFSRIPYRQAIHARLTKLWNFERFRTPEQKGGRYFYEHNSGLQNQNVLLVADRLDAAPRVLLDPNTLSNDGTVALVGHSLTDDGRLLAYGTAASGSDWTEWRLREVASGRDLDDVIRWVKFSGVSWTRDGRGFYYSRYDEPKESSMMQEANFFQKLYYHSVGTPQSADVLVYERPDNKQMLFDGEVTEDGKFLIITVREGSAEKTRLYYKDLATANAGVVRLLDDYDATYTFVGNEGRVFWLLTDQGAPRKRLVAVDIGHPERGSWKTLIPEGPDKIEAVTVIHHSFLLNCLEDAHSDVRVYDLGGRLLRKVPLPGIGTVEGLKGKATDQETFFSFTSYTVPPTPYRYDAVTGKTRVFREPQAGFDASRFETKQVFYQSKDGTRIPMFLTYKKGLKLDGQNPTILYGYGGFNIALTPTFSAANLLWVEMGGIFAVANLRGGSEYGEQWHEAGTKLKKQNVFDDFISAAEWLIAGKYTSTPRLAILGRSNGGLLVGACMTQRPDLFGVALPGVGVMDMLRFQKFTIGWAWTADYGSSDNAEEFRALYKYSPLHTLRPGAKYPPTLVVTSDHDDRVVPGHSFKFAAALQADQGAAAPVLIRIETKAGHGAGKPISKQIEENGDILSFAAYNMHMDVQLR